jgi:hypothetical protein
MKFGPTSTGLLPAGYLKTGGWTLGVLEAVTQARDFRDPSTGTMQTAPSAFFGVARIGHSIFQKSEIGFTSVNRVQNAGATYDVDGNLITARQRTASICRFSRVITLPGHHSSSPTRILFIPALMLSTLAGLLTSSTIRRL